MIQEQKAFMNAPREKLVSAMKNVAWIAVSLVGIAVSLVFAGAVVYIAFTSIVGAILLIALTVATIIDSIRFRGDPQWERDRRNTYWL